MIDCNSNLVNALFYRAHVLHVHRDLRDRHDLRGHHGHRLRDRHGLRLRDRHHDHRHGRRHGRRLHGHRRAHHLSLIHI